MARYEEHKLRNYSSLYSATIQRAIASITLPTTPYKKKKKKVYSTNIKDSTLGLADTSKHVSVSPGDSANDGEPYFDAYFLGREEGGGEQLQMKLCAIGILPSWKNAGYQRAEQYVKG